MKRPTQTFIQCFLRCFKNVFISHGEQCFKSVLLILFMSSIANISKTFLYAVWNSSFKNILKMSKIIVENRFYLRFINVEWKHHNTTFLQHVIIVIDLCIFKIIIKHQQWTFYFTVLYMIYKTFLSDIFKMCLKYCSPIFPIIADRKQSPLSDIWDILC